MTLKIINIIKRKFVKYFSKSICIFTNHQISDEFNPEIDCATDWSSIALFVKNVKWIQKHFSIISLEEAVCILNSKKKIKKNYAVFTFDDAYASLINAIKILEENNIPATIFVNSAYLDDKKLSPVNVINYINSKSEKELQSFPTELIEAVRNIENCNNSIDYNNCILVIDRNMDKIRPNTQVYLTRQFLSNLNKKLFDICLHGHEHFISIFLSDVEFENNLINNVKELDMLENFKPYFAFAYGIVDTAKIHLVCKMGYVPFLSNGQKCYKNAKAYNRIPIDGLDLTILKL